jgi:hypothetical protein
MSVDRCEESIRLGTDELCNGNLTLGPYIPNTTRPLTLCTRHAKDAMDYWTQLGWGKQATA